MMRRAGLLVFAVAAGCGQSPSPGTAEVVIGWPQSLSACDHRSDIGQSLSVQFYVGGYGKAPCNLNVDPNTLQASNVCTTQDPDKPLFSTGVTRPVLVAYRQKPPSGTGASAALAFFVGLLNLCPDHLKAGEDTVTLNLVDDGVNGKFFYRQSDITGITTSSKAPSCSFTLADAEGWAVGAGTQPAPIDPSTDALDAHCTCGTADPPGCTNLEQACAGTLFPLQTCTP